MELILCACVGIGLAAACGFRVFVPLLVMSIAARSGHLQLAQGFDWIGSWPAMVALTVATGLEIGAYYVPWLDNLLDSIATPAAFIAGTVATAAMVGDTSPMLQWALGVIAGGGAATAVQLTTVTVRAASSGLTGGTANPVVSTTEGVVSTGLSILAIAVPIIAALVVLTILYMLYRAVSAWRRPAMPAVAT